MHHEDREPSSSERPPSPLRLLLVTGVAIFATEGVIMKVLDAAPVLPPAVEGLIDATALTACLLPMLWWTWVRLLKRSIEDHSRARAVAQSRAYRDALTQLPNRLAFETNTAGEVERAQATGEAFTLVVVDIRRFSQINHALGQKNGDALLCLIAERLKSNLPHSEFVTRLGSDVFGVLLPGVTFDKAEDAARRLLQLLEAPFLLDATPIEVETHCGVAVFPTHGAGATVLLQRAEVALHLGKTLGERCKVYEEEDNSVVRRRVSLFGQLRAAVTRGQLSLVYQPKVELRTGKIVGAEALLRWQHPELGGIATEEFLAIAEQTSLVKPVTTWVLTEAVRQVAEWNAAGLSVRVSVNLSARNLTDESLPGLIAGLLLKWHVSPQSLIAEVTESAVMADPERAAAVLEQLDNLGVELSIDDFGTGYSSLTYLRTIPAKEVKIDRSFAQDVDTNQSNASIVRTVVDLAHALGLRVVAEGVETAAALGKLTALGCDLMQGYFVSRPLPPAKFAEFLGAHRQAFRPVSPPAEPVSARPEGVERRVSSVRPSSSLRDSLRSMRAVTVRTFSEPPH